MVAADDGIKNILQALRDNASAYLQALKVDEQGRYRYRRTCRPGSLAAGRKQERQKKKEQSSTTRNDAKRSFCARTLFLFWQKIIEAAVHARSALNSQTTAAMKAALRPPAPSRSLLRYLRTQTDDAFLAQGSSMNANRCPRQARFISTSRFDQRTSTQSIAAARSKLPPTSLRCAFSTTTPTKNKWASDKCKDDQPPSASWQERLWGMAARRGGKPLKPEDLPPEDFEQGSSMFNTRRVMTAKAAAEPRLRCTEVDENGEVILVDGEFKKTELIAKVSNHSQHFRARRS